MVLPRSTPREAHIDPRGILDFLDAQQTAGQEMHSLMVLRGGQVIAEGWWDPWRPNHSSLLYSMSKTFTSAALGLAVSDGLLSYDDLVVDHFPDLVDDTVGPKSRTIKVRDCLSMSTGHLTDVLESNVRPATSAAPTSSDLVRHFLSTEPDGAVGETFCYNNLASYLCSALVSRLTGRTVLALLKERVFDALGITDARWITADGVCQGFSGLHLRTEDVACFFQLLSDGGRHRGEQLLPLEWIEQFSTAHTDNSPPEEDQPLNPDWGQGYGWQIWRSRHGYRGDGAFGQFACVLDEMDLVVVITGQTEDMQRTLTNLWQHLLPAVDRSGSAADEQRLAERLGSLRLATVVGATRHDADVSAHNEAGSRLHLIGTTLKIIESDGVGNSCTVTSGVWTPATMRWPHGSLQVAATGAWIGDEFVAKVACLNSPHWFWVHMTDESARVEWALTPLSTDQIRGLTLPPRAHSRLTSSVKS